MEHQDKIQQISDLLGHLREKAFKSLITWTKNQCIVKDCELFESIILSSWELNLNLGEFLLYCERLDITINISSRNLIINLPKLQKPIPIKRLKTDKNTLIEKEVRIMEHKQEIINKKLARLNYSIQKSLTMNNNIMRLLKS